MKSYPLACAVFTLLFLAVGRANANDSLETLAAFSVPYETLPERGFLRPVVSLSQSFKDDSNVVTSSVVTAFPISVPRHIAWDLRALTVDVLVGRRERGGGGSRFEYDWNALPLLRRQTKPILSLYDDCNGVPCQQPIQTIRNLSTSLSDAVGTVDTEKFDWGNLYRIAVYFSRKPDRPGLTIDASDIWFVYSAEMPRFYLDDVDDQPYEIHHWMPVWASSSTRHDLAIRDYGNVLGRGWPTWQHGHDLQYTLYEGLAYPSPAFALIGYSRPAGTTRPRAPTMPENQTGAPVSPEISPPSSNSALGGVFVDGLIVAGSILGAIALFLGAMFAIGMWRKRQRRLNRRLGSLYQNVDHADDDSTSIGIAPDGAFRLRTDQSQSQELHTRGVSLMASESSSSGGGSNSDALPVSPYIQGATALDIDDDDDHGHVARVQYDSSDDD